MEKEKQIKEMTNLIKSTRARCSGECDMDISCNECDARQLFNAGYGNVKQAVKEFAEKLKGLCDKKRKLFEKLYDKCAPRQAQLANSFIERRNEWIEMKQKIDNFITELYGADEL